MSFKLLGGGSDLNTVISDMNTNILELKNREVTEIFKDDTGTRRVILDKDGLRTSPAGVDVVTAGNDELTFNSNQNVFKIVASGTSSLTGSDNISAGDTQTQTVAHNLGYTPTAIVYANAPNGGISGFQGGNGITSTPVIYGLLGELFFFAQHRLDDTNIYFDLVVTAGTNNDLSDLTWSFKYYLLQETAN